MAVTIGRYQVPAMPCPRLPLAPPEVLDVGATKVWKTLLCGVRRSLRWYYCSICCFMLCLMPTVMISVLFYFVGPPYEATKKLCGDEAGACKTVILVIPLIILICLVFCCIITFAIKRATMLKRTVANRINKANDAVAGTGLTFDYETEVVKYRLNGRQQKYERYFVLVKRDGAAAVAQNDDQPPGYLATTAHEQQPTPDV